MKNAWKRSLSIMLVLVMILGAVACTKAPEPSAPAAEAATEAPVAVATEAPAAPEEKIIYSNGGPQEFFETPWLNPGTFMYNKTIYAHLIVADSNLNPIPNHPDAMATYEYSADGKTLTFTLRDNVYWHNGNKVTGDDIKWSIEFVAKTPVCNSVFASTFSAILGAKTDGVFNETFEGIVVDGQKITITFDQIAPDALLTFTQFAPVPKSEFEGVDPVQVQQAPFFQHPIGAGPFMIEEVSMNNYTTLKPFDKYYNGVADFKIQLLPSAGDSDSNLVTRVLAGQLDYGYTKMVADIEALKGIPGITVSQINARYTRMFYLDKFANKDGSVSPLADVRVRQAIRYAIDMKTICETILMGAAVPADVLIPSATDKASGLNAYDYNPEKAKALLADAGWDSNTVLKCVYYYKDQGTVDLMTAIQAYLAEVGIKFEASLVEGDLGTLLWSAPADQTNGPRAVDWDICYGAVAALSLHEYYNRFRTGSSSNSHTPEDAELNRLIDATNASANFDEQVAAFKELSKYENESMFAMALYYQPMFLITSDKIGDIQKGTPQFCIDWDIVNWDVQ